MNDKVVPFCHPRHMREQTYQRACTWMMELHVGLSPEAEERFLQWLSEHPDHPRTLVEIATLWDEMNVLSELSSLFPLEEFSHARKRRDARHLSPFRRVGWACGTLALSALVACVAVWMHSQYSPGRHRSATSAQIRYSTNIGEQLHVTLPDGSEALLNTQTSLDVDYSASQRMILLERGEVYFTVTKDAARPFRVRAGNGVVEAVGTAFTVQRTPSEGVQVAVTEGKVTLSATHRAATPAESVRLTESRDVREGAMPLVAGQLARLDEGGKTVQRTEVSPEESDARLAWRYGMLFFQGETLEAVLREVNRYTTVRIEADADIRGIPVIGVFRVDNIERLLTAMRHNFEIDVERIDDTRIRLVRRKHAQQVIPQIPNGSPQDASSR